MVGVLLAIVLGLPAQWPVFLRSVRPTTTSPADPGQSTTLSTRDEEPPSTLGQVQDALEAVVSRIRRSVVHIQVNLRPGSGKGADPASFRRTGSGFVLRPDGMILTNQHVVGEAMAIHVRLPDGRRCRARLVSADPRSDLAVLHVDAGGLAALPMAEVEAVRPGHLVLAAGFPAGPGEEEQASLGLGLVSGLRRPLPEWFGEEEDRYYGDMIQTSASVGPGHSGGPLVDIQGRAIGVITVGVDGGGPPPGLAYAVPICRRTRDVIERLLAGRSVEYGFLGVRAAEVEGTPAAGGEGRAVVLAAVAGDGPAWACGLRRGDIIVSLDGAAVTSSDAFIQRIGERGPGAEAEIEFEREGRREKARARLARRPATWRVPAEPAVVAFRGAELGSVESDRLRGLGLPEGALVVLLVRGGSPADRAGLSPGDIIVRVEGRPVGRDTGDLLASLQGECLIGLASGGTVLVGGE
jgi:serine protease Do